MTRPLAIDLFCGLGGWTEGLLAEGYDVIGFDIERHQYGEHRYPAQLVVQDVLTLHGAQFRDAALIVASPPCQAYSYRAMPWKRAKALLPPDNTLFDACFRIQREACEAAGRHVPLIVENVRGAQKWVGRARFNFGSYYFWGDVPALMPIAARAQKFNPDGTSHGQGSWFAVADSKHRGSQKVPGFRFDGSGRSFQSAAVKHHGSGAAWFDTGPASFSSGSPRRKEASALIAKIPFEISEWIARCFKPTSSPVSSVVADTSASRRVQSDADGTNIFTTLGSEARRWQ